jgi:transposase
LNGCKDCQKYEKEINLLKEQNNLLKFEIAEIKSKLFNKSKKKNPPKQDTPLVPSKKKGGLFGHTGWFRKKPKRIDKIQEVKLSKCPECGSSDISLCADKYVEEHLQEDIILPRTETTMYRKYRYYCKKCKITVSGRGKGEIPKSRIGPLTKVLAIFLKYDVKVSDNDINKIFKQMFGLRMAVSAIAGFRDQISRELEPLYERLKEQLKLDNFIHADETGWRVDGDNRWLWKFSNKRVSITHIDKSRGQKVVSDILGEKYDGVLVSDFLSAYNKIKSKKQRCLAHIMRDLEKVIKYWDEEDEQTVTYCKRLIEILMRGINLHREYSGRDWDEKYCRRRKQITDQLKDFSFPDPDKKLLVRFAKRLERHKDEIFTFLYERDVDYHNNHAEQQIRPNVILRKITFGNRSESGVANHNVLMSIIQTAKMNRLDVINSIKHIFETGSDKTFLEAIAGPP